MKKVKVIMFLYDDPEDLEKYQKTQTDKVLGLDAKGDYDNQSLHYLMDDMYVPLEEFRIVGDHRAEKLAEEYGAKYEKWEINEKTA